MGGKGLEPAEDFYRFVEARSAPFAPFLSCPGSEETFQNGPRAVPYHLRPPLTALEGNTEAAR